MNARVWTMLIRKFIKNNLEVLVNVKDTLFLQRRDLNTILMKMIHHQMTYINFVVVNFDKL